MPNGSQGPIGGFCMSRSLVLGLVRKIEGANPDQTLGDAVGMINGLTGILAKW